MSKKDQNQDYWSWPCRVNSGIGFGFVNSVEVSLGFSFGLSITNIIANLIVFNK